MRDARSVPDHKDRFRLGEHWIDPNVNEIGGARVDAKAMDVLVALVGAMPHVLPAAALLDRVWPNVVVGDNVVHQAIAHLRRALGDRARDPRYIEHVARRGYRLIAPIERAAPSPSQRADEAPGIPPDTTRHNLPAPLTSFVGRVRETADVRQLLDVHRLITLTGLGGAGKTRFALELARSVPSSSFPDGVRLVELASLADPRQVVQAIAAALRLREGPGQELLDTLQAAISTKRMLLVLDNCEHLVDACARLVEALLQRAPELKILATSREALDVAGEHAWRVQSLAMPDLEDLAPPSELIEIESVRLFVERAREAQPSFDLTNENAVAVAQICRRLDGIPLAIELAAARVRVLTPEQIAGRLNDRFRLLTRATRTAVPHQQTLQATLDWSYALLEPSEQALLRRLAVFAGGCTLEAAEAVTAFEPLTTSTVIDLLARLMDKSWLPVSSRSGGVVRYLMLETVRQYADERLRDATEGDQLGERHREYFDAFAERAADALRGKAQRTALATFDAEHDNLQTALTWCANGNAKAGLRLASHLWRYWMMRGLATSGRRSLEDFLTRTAETADTAAPRASALLGAGWMARFQGDSAAAGRQLTQSAELFRSLGDHAGEAEALSNRASNLIYTGEAEQGERVSAQALELARRAGDPYVTSYCLQTFGDQRALCGDFERARALLDEGVAVLRTLGHEQSLAFALAKLGSLLLQQGELAPARSALEEAHALHQNVGEGLGIDHTLLRLGWLAHHEGNDHEARSLLERALVIADEAGFVPEAASATAMLGRLALYRGELDRARGLLTTALARGHDVQAHDVCASCLEALAMVAKEQREDARAARLLSGADRIRKVAVRPLPPIERREYERGLRVLRKALGKADFAAAWASGEGLTVEQMVARFE